jgi:hypothetical protein
LFRANYGYVTVVLRFLGTLTLTLSLRREREMIATFYSCGAQIDSCVHWTASMHTH